MLRGRDESNSVVNQRRLLEQYHQAHLDEFYEGAEADVYVDDGKTGTDTNREDFQRLLSDISSGRINCVIVKDLSRLSRNYTDAGNLIENLFVRLNVRFISLAEGVDSYSPTWIDGKKHARNVYAHTREECEEKLKVLIAEMKAELAELKRQKADSH